MDARDETAIDEHARVLAGEQAHLDAAYLALAAMRGRTEAAVAIAAADARSGEVDANVTEAHLQRRLRELEVDVPGLAFGRIDASDLAPGAEGHRIGRRHVEGASGEVLVVDWRAPVATAFYRATPADPQGLRRRRRFATTGRRIDAVFEEDFDDPDSIGSAHGGVPDPVLAELERARGETMRDIVATIAAEQDEVIRAPASACLVVQGGPGTGKTAVGLHRAAYLLYEHRQELTEQGVLVVGPNPTFLRYISQVLPSLGERSVRQATLAGLVGGSSDAPLDPPARAALLGDGRWAAVARAALAGLRRPPDGDLDLRTGWGFVRLTAEDVAAVVAEIERRGVPHETGRTALRTMLVRLVRLAVEKRRGPGTVTSEAIEADLRRTREFGAALDRLWPTTSGAALARRLVTGATALAAATAAADAGGDGGFDPGERAVLVRRAARGLSGEAWTVAELVLVDECRALVEGAPRSYGHVVVDEAQDLTALGLRAIGRRCPSGSLTLLGDLAQATAPGAQRSWDEAVEHLGPAGAVRHAELTVGYRVPGAVLAWANRLLADAAPGVRPAASVRAGGRAPAVDGAASPREVAPRAVAEALRLASVHATVGIVVPAALRPALDEALAAAPGRPPAPALQVVGPSEAKGLEFDAVVVAEPAALVDEAGGGRAGLRLLYVALTRAVQELVVVHHEPLPRTLAGGEGGGSG